MNAKGMADHIDYDEVPYGNAQGTGSNVQCQHGPDECKGNRYECCAIQEYPNATQWYPFIYCMENYGDSMLQHVQDCANEASLSYDKIQNCYSGPDGDKCVTNAADKTNNLQPPHQYTPWVTVNGRHLAGAQHLISVVCSEIKSATKPDICSQSTDDDDGMWADDGNTEPCMRDW
mmetsp:Transcript_2906/g.6943  ORF Transcript_2906/g.6943 Transcript_2906/m.6943 type:complete len:175 (-) Transcript_2906:617-1141(-)